MGTKDYSGTVKFFNELKGYGFIKEGSTDKEYFVHISDLHGITLKKDDKVTFTLEETKKGLKAVNINHV